MSTYWCISLISCPPTSNTPLSSFFEVTCCDDDNAIIDADDFLTAEDIRTSLDDSFIDIAVDDDACTDDDACDAPSVNVASVESLMCFGSTMIDVLP